ncbi:MAG: hypothetical protein LBJ88_05990 [Campylobacteraceae bacterium]|jgi:hypothetical protein|nr:hypothetical protein [Campylobacteraceae bacterium]
MKLKIFMVILYALLAVFLFLIFLPPFICCGGNYKLSKVDFKEMIEQAKQGNDTAMMKLRDHYIGNKAGMSAFYQYKVYETRYSLLGDEYKQLSEYAKFGNETTKYRIDKYNDISKIKQELIYDYFDKDIETIEKFLKVCSLDNFCNSSDIYEYYSQKVKNINENETQK